LASLRVEATKAAEVDQLRERGELIYAWLWQIAPGQTELIVDGTTVPLDPQLSAKENAQAYFERYRKAQSANDNVPELVARTETELTYLDQLATMVAQAEGFAELESLAAEWSNRQGPTASAGRRAPGKRATGRQDKRPRPLLDRHGNAVYVGRTGAQNDFVTFDLAGPDDTWLHARGVPGSHVVVRWHRPGLDDDPETIEAAAALAAFYSAARDSARVEVDATKRRHVRKIKGAGPGMVTYRQERTLAVRPADETGVRATLKARAESTTPQPEAATGNR
jgi:predicted ribosome quality control (RQC) complex YloA/Tae2 family protein